MKLSLSRNGSSALRRRFLRQIDGLTVEQCAVAARAFTLFFLLINTAEQTHRVRRRNAYSGTTSTEPQPASARWTMKQLRAVGASADQIEKAMLRLHIRPSRRAAHYSDCRHEWQTDCWPAKPRPLRKSV
jgi:phosphoenolpyruvate carboxylase